jgi:hypothetical protein
MSLRISIGDYWLKIDAFCPLMVRAYIYFNIEYGHRSRSLLTHLRRHHDGRIWFKWRKRKSVLLR